MPFLCVPSVWMWKCPLAFFCLPGKEIRGLALGSQVVGRATTSPEITCLPEREMNFILFEPLMLELSLL